MRSIPPCPKDLVDRITSTKCDSRVYVADATPDAGSVWEVEHPDGRIVDMMIVEHFPANVAAPFSFVRAVPLSSFIRLASAGDAIVITDKGVVFVAHLWLEGPVLETKLLRCFGKVDLSRGSATIGDSENDSADMQTYRAEIFEEIDPIYCTTWHRLYEIIGK